MTNYERVKAWRAANPDKWRAQQARYRRRRKLQKELLNGSIIDKGSE